MDINNIVAFMIRGYNYKFVIPDNIYFPSILCFMHNRLSCLLCQDYVVACIFVTLCCVTCIVPSDRVGSVTMGR